MLCLPFASGYTYAEIPCSKFGSIVEVESTYWGIVKLFNTQNKLMEVYQSDISKILLFISFVKYKRRHEALRFGGRGKVAVLYCLYILRGPSLPRSSTHSTVQYISIHPSPCTQQPPKYHICSMKKGLLKTR